MGMHSGHSDSELMKRSLNGDVEAFTALVCRYRDVPYAAAYSLVHDFHDARDIAQEAWIKAYRRLITCDPDRHFGAWLYGISRRCAIDWLNRRRLPTEDLSAAANVHDPRPQPDEEQEKREICEMVRRALSSLSEANRATTVLYYINGYSQRDISGILGVPLGTVKRRLHESRNSLRRDIMEMVRETFAKNELEGEFAQEVSAEMIEWYVKPSYTAELANFLWSIGEESYYSRAYKEEKALWRCKLGRDVASKVDEFIDFGRTAISQSALGNIFHFSDAESLDEMIAELDSLESLKRRVLKAKPSDPGWIDSIFMHLEENRVLFQQILDALKQADYDGYWQREIQPVVSRRCEELHGELSNYSVKKILMEINGLLGPQYNIEHGPKPMYLTYFGYPLAYGVPDDGGVHSFRGDRPEPTMFVGIFIHLLLYNYSPGGSVLEHLEQLSKSQFYARNLEMYKHYWGGGPYKDFIVAAEKYISVKLGVVSDEKAFHHLYTNQDGTSVLGVIIYDNMSTEKLEGKTYDEFLSSLFEERVIEPATLEGEYYRILEKRVGKKGAEKRREDYQHKYARYEAGKCG